MNSGASIRDVIVIAALVALCIGGYVWYRFHNTLESPYATWFSTSESIPPTYCTFQEGGFSSSNSGDAYFDGRAVRVDQTQVINGYTGIVHIISYDAQTFYIWGQAEYTTQSGRPDFSYTMNRSDYTAYVNQESAMLSTSEHCTPWWIPSGGVFMLPATIDFNRTAAQM